MLESTNPMLPEMALVSVITSEEYKDLIQKAARYLILSTKVTNAEIEIAELKHQIDELETKLKEAEETYDTVHDRNMNYHTFFLKYPNIWSVFLAFLGGKNPPDLDQPFKADASD